MQEIGAYRQGREQPKAGGVSTPGLILPTEELQERVTFLVEEPDG